MGNVVAFKTLLRSETAVSEITVSECESREKERDGQEGCNVSGKEERQKLSIKKHKSTNT